MMLVPTLEHSCEQSVGNAHGGGSRACMQSALKRHRFNSKLCFLNLGCGQNPLMEFVELELVQVESLTHAESLMIGRCSP